MKHRVVLKRPTSSSSGSISSWAPRLRGRRRVEREDDTFEEKRPLSDDDDEDGLSDMSGRAFSPRTPLNERRRRRRKPWRLGGVVILVALGAWYLGGWSRRQSRIGDFETSERDASLLFDILDADADGEVEQAELEAFVGDAIGGHVLDSREEIEAGVASILDAADSNADARLSTAETFAYWKTLGSLLSVDEVAQWVEHAAQLPTHVARKFRDASVSGYDFAELVRDGSSETGALAKIGVKHARQRTKLVRAMRMRLTGVGRTPKSPGPLLVLGKPKCGEVRLAWSHAQGGNFPTHKYRLERRIAGASRVSLARTLFRLPFRIVPRLFGPTRDDDDDDDCDPSNQTCDRPTPNNGWTCVLDDYAHEFVDSGVVPGSAYEYRLTAWNAIGRSHHAYRPVSAKRDCEPLEFLDAWALAPLTRAAHTLYALFQIFISVFVVACALLKLGHSADGQHYHPIFGRLWTALYAALTRTPLRRLLPPFFFEVATNHELHRPRRPGYADPTLVGTLGVKAMPPEMSAAAQQQHRHKPPTRHPELRELPPALTSSSHRSAWPGDDDDNIKNITRANSMPEVHPQHSPHSSYQSSRDDDAAAAADDDDEIFVVFARSDAICHRCRRPFDMLRRSKHHCYACAKPFCRHCGRICHSQFRTCPVGSKCVCFSCYPPSKQPGLPKPLTTTNLRAAAASSASTVGAATIPPAERRAETANQRRLLPPRRPGPVQTRAPPLAPASAPRL
ncbi:hypothetical protein CTAYLR_002952 [Chrysophaeum taylorii]|uniref:Uncharacterized protein n=1 Tax=Chrysophaeum taylorii TaxID=2483200 RepID=A0AAD7UNG1_9STRA|nr:hypothetical protein CTAYLR_002952 [Chrysophaeum taylorii]